MLSKEFNLKKLKVEEDYFEALSHYSWRGNIRELRNVIEGTIVLLRDKEKLSLYDLPEKIVKAYNYKSLKNKLRLVKDTKNDSSSLMKMSEEIVIEMLLHEENGNLSRVADRLGISRTTLYNKINGNEKLKNNFTRHKIG
jgi:DNA-binding NtrC family response regulator